MSHTSRFKFVRVLVASAALLGSAGVLAATITYTMTGTGTGTVGATPFTNAAYTITMVGDTTAVTGTTLRQNNVTATMAIAGIGTATITELVDIFDNHSNSTVGLQRQLSGLDLIDGTNAAFATYDLASNIGPISGLTATALGQFTNLGSTLGPITMPSSSTFTFQATVGGAPPPPPPTTATIPTLSENALLLLVLVTAALGAILLRRRR